jgi:hypothetical protein
MDGVPVHRRGTFFQSRDLSDYRVFSEDGGDGEKWLRFSMSTPSTMSPITTQLILTDGLLPQH